MRYAVLAVDYDGTIAPGGRVAPATLAATGRKLVLVTGRELEGLLAIFPAIGIFDPSAGAGGRG